MHIPGQQKNEPVAAAANHGHKVPIQDVTGFATYPFKLYLSAIVP